MKYMLLIYSPEHAWTPNEWNQCVATLMDICQEMAAEGKFLAASTLHPITTATTVRMRNGKAVFTTGPFTETIERLCGFYLIDVEQLDEAISIAGRLPPAKKGTAEIRPIFKLDGLPAEKFEPESVAPLRKFMFLCYDGEAAWSAAGLEAHMAAMQEAVNLTHRLVKQGQFLSASPLHPIATATSVRVRNEHRSVTDEPFTETREVLGGYYLILAKDQQAAVEIAAEHSGVQVGAVEVREVFDLSGAIPS